MGFNVFVDPKDIFRVAKIDNFNKEKPLAYVNNSLRVVKSLDLENGNYNTLILGTSRAFYGLDPQHLPPKADNAYNLGMTQMGMEETYKIFQFSRSRMNIEAVVIALDFELFSSGNDINEDFYKSRFSNRNIFLSNLDGILSTQYVRDALETIAFNREGKEAEDLGFYSEDPYSLRYIRYRKRFDWVTKDLFSWSKDSNYNPAALQFFEDLVIECLENDIDLYVFIAPSHVVYWEVLQKTGHFSSVEQWKRDIIQVLEKANQKYPHQPQIQLWDFSGYNSIAMEEIPEAGSDTEMQWYYEPVHYTPAVGNLIYERIFQIDLVEEPIPQDFGVTIDAENIEAHLQQIRRDRERYRDNYPEEVERVERFWKEVQAEN